MFKNDSIPFTTDKGNIVYILNPPEDTADGRPMEYYNWLNWHRLDGPACISHLGYQYYWVDNQCYEINKSLEEHLRYMKAIREYIKNSECTRTERSFLYAQDAKRLIRTKSE